MTSRDKVFRVHRALAILYGLVSAGFVWLFSQGSLPSMASAVVLVILTIFATHTVLAIAARQGQAWARMASMVVGGLMLLGFPVGTLIGAYLIYHTKDDWH